MRIKKTLKNHIRKHIDVIKRLIWHTTVKFEMMRQPAGDLYARRVNAMHRRLQIPVEYFKRGLSFHHEAAQLIPVPCGLDRKIVLMTPGTMKQFLAMQDAASAEGVNLFVRWGFRSVDDQAQLLRKQLSYGKEIDWLLTWIAAPGYSEHHTGRALDFETIPAEMDFEDTREFTWLCENAEKFQFRLSYPRNNGHGIIYEPWHWYFFGEDV